MKKLLEKIGYTGNISDIENITNFIIAHRVNFYTRIQHANGNIYWRVYIEPFDEIGGLEFNYLWNVRENAVKAGIIAAACYILDYESFLHDLDDKIFNIWCELNYGPDFKINNSVGPSNN